MRPLGRSLSADLETQLAGVLEQDGITMAAPEGIRRRAKRSSRFATAPFLSVRSLDVDEQDARHMSDQVADLDRVSIDLMVKAVGTRKTYTVPIVSTPQPRSAYVLSLQHVCISASSTNVEEYVPVQAVLETVPVEGDRHEAAVYGTLSQDLRVDRYDPQCIAEQFTPADFKMASVEVYSRFRRARAVFSVLLQDVVSLLQRVERVERAVEDDVENVLTVVDVPRLSFARSVIGFAAMLLLVTLPANALGLYRSASETRTAVEAVGNAALQDILDAKQADSLPSSVASLQHASSRFREADAMLSESNALALGLAAVVPQQYRAARALLEVGDKTSTAGRVLASGFEKVFRDPTRRIDERLDVLATYANSALPLLTEAAQAAATVDPNQLPSDKRQTFVTLATRLESGAQAVREFAGMAEFLSVLAGKNETRKYLVVFQNNTELRPSGGFMGSVAEITVDRGDIKNFFVPPGGTYDLKGQLLAHVVAPKPLQLINPHWQFQDANWFADFPTTAKKIRWFWSKAGQPTLDGVIAVNATFVQRLFEVTGPIEMPEYGKVIDQTNFLNETQKAVELEYDRTENTPKKFVGDLSKRLLERMKTFTSDDWLKVAGFLSDGLQTKEIQVSLSNADEQSLAERYGWAGRVKETAGDRLSLIEANIAGQKTDGVIDEDVQFTAEIQDDGSIIDTVTLTRKHNGQKGELFRGVRNVSYLRAYVPKGSQLLSAEGFQTPSSSLFKKPDDDYVLDSDDATQDVAVTHFSDQVDVMEENGQAVFGGWLQLDPGMSQTIRYRYRLPFAVQDMLTRLETVPADQASARAAYLLLLTSQSGRPRSLTASFKVTPAWRIRWQRGTNDAATQGAYSGVFAGEWNQDRVMAGLLSPAQTAQE